MRYIEAPMKYWGKEISLFMAGGISNCPDWQYDLVDKLRETDLIVYNPRRSNFPMGNMTEGLRQIEWEHDFLKDADIISFWFPKETLCPIALFELGSWSMTDKPIFVGCHPDYKRRFDVETQLRLRHPYVKVVYDLDCLARQIIDYHSSRCVNEDER